MLKLWKKKKLILVNFHTSSSLTPLNLYFSQKCDFGPIFFFQKNGVAFFSDAFFDTNSFSRFWHLRPPYARLCYMRGEGLVSQKRQRMSEGAPYCQALLIFICKDELGKLELFAATAIRIQEVYWNSQHKIDLLELGARYEIKKKSLGFIFSFDNQHIKWN